MGFEDIMKIGATSEPTGPQAPVVSSNMGQFAQSLAPGAQPARQPVQVAGDPSLIDRARQVFNNFLFGQQPLRDAAKQGSGAPAPAAAPAPDPGEMMRLQEQYKRDAERALGKPTKTAAPKMTAPKTPPAKPKPKSGM